MLRQAAEAGGQVNYPEGKKDTAAVRDGEGLSEKVQCFFTSKTSCIELPSNTLLVN